jgi:hypothetical protein
MNRPLSVDDPGHEQRRYFAVEIQPVLENKAGDHLAGGAGRLVEPRHVAVGRSAGVVVDGYEEIGLACTDCR